LTIFIIVL